MHFRVNPTDGLPIYRQIMRQVVDAIAGGQLQSGARLPSHRELAQTLVVAPLTIKKAYDELEKQGYVRMQRGQGSFVTSGPEMSSAERVERLRPQVQRLLSDAAVIGVDGEAVRRLFDQEAKRLSEGRAPGGGVPPEGKPKKGR